MSERYHDSGSIAVDKTMEGLHLPDSKKLSKLTDVPTMEDSIVEAQRTTLIQSINEDMVLAEKFIMYTISDTNNEVLLSEVETKNALKALEGWLATKLRQATQLWATIDSSQIHKAEDLERIYETLPELTIQAAG